ncbi:MAG: nitrilase-related carbon-nitrogen hydrolase, partial [Anaerolineales bacterium]
MKVGYIQFQPFLGERDKTIASLDPLLRSASSADLLVLPELCNSGYNFPDYQFAHDSAEEIGGSVFIDFLCSCASDYGLYIVSGFNEREDETLYNSAVLVGPGGYLGKYRKLHLFMNEKDYFQPGNAGLPLFDLGSIKIGMLVCFDWVFPEVWRILALGGADLVCHPSNLVLPGFAQRAIPIHALVNRIHVITCNRIGQEGELTFTGLSTIAAPNGDVVLQASR